MSAIIAIHLLLSVFHLLLLQVTYYYPYEWMKPSFSSQHSIALRPWAQRAYFERQKSTTHSRPGAWDVGTSGRGPRGMPGFFLIGNPWKIHGKSMENPWKSIKRDEQSMKISIWLIFFGCGWLEDLVDVSRFCSFFCWEFHHPNWRSHIFQRGRYTTNQKL